MSFAEGIVWPQASQTCCDKFRSFCFFFFWGGGVQRGALGKIFRLSIVRWTIETTRENTSDNIRFPFRWHFYHSAERTTSPSENSIMPEIFHSAFTKACLLPLNIARECKVGRFSFLLLFLGNTSSPKLQRTFSQNLFRIPWAMLIK